MDTHKLHQTQCYISDYYGGNLQARIIFGNNLVPSTLVIRLEEGKCNYSTRNATNQTDLYMHMFKCHAENVRVMFTPSKDYNGPEDP